MKKEKKNENVIKEITPGIFFKNFIVVSLLIAYILFYFMNIVVVLSEDPPYLVIRYIPAVIVACFAFIYIRSNAKKCKESDKDEFKKFAKIAPVIVAVVIAIYGYYSIASNYAEMEDELDSYVSLFGEEVLEEVEKVKSKGNTVWTITAIIYLVVAEGIVFFLDKKIDHLFVKEENASISKVLEEKKEDENEFTETTETTETTKLPINNVKWDL